MNPCLNKNVTGIMKPLRNSTLVCLFKIGLQSHSLLASYILQAGLHKSKMDLPVHRT